MPGMQGKGLLVRATWCCFWTRGPVLFLVSGNSGTPDDLFLLGSQHFLQQGSQVSLGKGGAARWD